MQLVLSGKRVITHGENFIAMGGTVINPDTGAVYQNATIAECDCCPADIDRVGYEYHAGEFVPCPPYGTGTGNIAVWCDDCKTPLDSGMSMSDFRKIYHTTYTGTGSSTCGVTCGFRPKRIIITGWNEWTSSAEGFWVCVIDTDTVMGYGYGLTIDKNGNASGMVKCTATDTGATWTATATTTTSNAAAMNVSSSGQTYNYSITVFG